MSLSTVRLARIAEFKIFSHSGTVQDCADPNVDHDRSRVEDCPFGRPYFTNVHQSTANVCLSVTLYIGANRYCIF